MISEIRTDLALMRRIDKLHLEYPFAGSRMLQGLLLAEGYLTGRLHVATLMKRMEIEALYRRPNTSKPSPGHKIFPYLLRKLPVTRPNQVWAMDITDIPMARCFVYLTAVVDWFSRKVLARRLSITMVVAFCIDAVEEAMARFGRPEIFITDQGSQFTSREFTSLLIGASIKISMYGRGAWRDNVFVERIWKSVKYEEVYLRAYASVSEACTSKPTSTRSSQSRPQHNQGRNPLRARLERLRGQDKADSRKLLNLTWMHHVDLDHAVAA
jgi:putative transposase